MMNPSLRAGALRPAAFALAAMAACAVQAQQGAAHVLDDVVVTATRTAQPLTDVLADVSIVDRETIEQSGATGLGDVLARLPGIEMARSGGPGGTTSMFVRGAETRFTAVYVDGVRVDSQAGSGGTTWEAIPLAQIERIEVLRGPAAAVYGSDAVAGVIQIFTKKGEAGVAPYVGVGAGSHGTYRAEAGVSGASGAVDYALGITRETSKGFNAKKDGNPDRDDYRGTSASGRLGWQLNTAHRLEGNFLYNDTDSGYDVSKTADDRRLHRLQALGLGWQAQWSDSYKTRLSVTDSRDRYETRPSVYFTDTRLRGYLFFNELRVGAHQFTAALERREDELTNESVSSGMRSRAQNALALGYGLRMGAHTVQLNARHDEDSEFGGKTTGSAAYGYALTPEWRAHASIGTAFRAPTFNDLYYPASAFTAGNPDVKPEESQSYELGIRGSHGWGEWSVNAYENQIDDLIVWAGTSPMRPENVDVARIRGIETSVATVLAGWDVAANLPVMDPQDRSKANHGHLLQRRARRQFTLDVDRQFGAIGLGASLYASSERFDKASNSEDTRMPGYALMDLRSEYRIDDAWRLQVKLANLFDRDYETTQTYEQPGRAVYFTVRYQAI